MKKTILTLLTIVMSAWLVTLWAQNKAIMDTPYPSGVRYLPPPPDTLSMAFAYDMHRYIYSKTLRDTERGEQALKDVGYGISYITDRMAGVFGLNAFSSRYGAIRSLVSNTISYVNQASGAVKSYYNRRRPFDRFNDPVFGPETALSLRQQGSYPSAHATLGWTCALVMSEINPMLQDDLFESGYEYGQSRLIIGAHWQSDVDAARLQSSATFARLHANAEYLDMLGRAQAMYDSVTNNVRPTALNQLHPFVTFMPSMPDSTSAAFAHDVATFYQNKPLRTEARGEQAQQDADMSVSGIGQAFKSQLGINITATGTPHIYRLVETAITQADENCQHLQAQNYRTPPYRRLNETAMAGTLSSSKSSYPSRHATVGWVAAMILMDICPSHQNEILLRGREYGQSRVIAGTNWQSDVDAGQLLGGMVFANLMSDASFRELVLQAQQEFNAVSSIQSIEVQPDAVAPQGYTLDGRRANNESRGVIVFSDGTKVVR